MLRISNSGYFNLHEKLDKLWHFGLAGRVNHPVNQFSSCFLWLKPNGYVKTKLLLGPTNPSRLYWEN